MVRMGGGLKRGMQLGRKKKVKGSATSSKSSPAFEIANAEKPTRNFSDVVQGLRVATSAGKRSSIIRRMSKAQDGDGGVGSSRRMEDGELQMNLVTSTVDRKRSIGLVTHAAPSDELFDHYRNEASHVLKLLLRESNRIWRRAVTELGTDAATLFKENDSIQKTLGLSAADSRSILAGSERVVDKWGNADSRLLLRAVELVKECLVSPYEMNTKCSTIEIVDDDTVIESKALVMIHVWNSRREGRAFQHALKSLTQTRQDIMLPPVVAVPYSVAVFHYARLVTVTWLVPLLQTRQAPLEGSIMQQVEEVWRSALGMSKETVPLPLYAGGDGRFYCCSLKVLTNSLLSNDPETTKHERFEYNCRDDQVELVRTGKTASAYAHTKNGVTDRLLPAIRQKLQSHQTIRNAGDEFWTHLFHACGVNMQSLLYVANVGLLTAPSGDDDDDDDDRSNKTSGPVSSIEEEKKESQALLVNAIATEVAARALKGVILAKIAAQFDESPPASSKEAEAGILAVANEAFSQFTKSSRYVRETVLKAVERKFTNAPEFALDMKAVDFKRVVRHLESRLGLHFHASQKEFTCVTDPIVHGSSGRWQLPHSALRDSYHMSLEFLSAQKTCRRLDDVPRRTLAAISSVVHATTGMHIGIDGCVAIFTESLNDTLSFHAFVMEKLGEAGASGGSTGAWSSIRGSFSANGRRGSASTTNPSSSHRGSVAAMIASVMGTTKPAPHLLLTSILGDFVRQETNVLTISEFDLLFKMSSVSLVDRCFTSTRCLFLFAYFAGHTDEEVRQLAVFTLVLWATALGKGLESFSPSQLVIEYSDWRNNFDDTLIKAQSPHTSNLERFVECVLHDAVMNVFPQLPQESQTILVRALILSSAFVTRRKALKCASLIISIIGQGVIVGNDLLHPVLAEGLVRLHGMLPRGSATAFALAVLVAPSVLHLAAAALLVREFLSEVQAARRLLRRKLTYLNERELFAILSPRKYTDSMMNFVSEGRIIYDKFQAARVAAAQKRRARYRNEGTTDDDDDNQNDDNDDSSAWESDEDVSSATGTAEDCASNVDVFDNDDTDGTNSVGTTSSSGTGKVKRAIGGNRVGYKVVEGMVTAFHQNPASIEHSSREKIIHEYQQSHLKLKQQCRRIIIADRCEQEFALVRFLRQRDLEEVEFAGVLKRAAAVFVHRAIFGYDGPLQPNYYDKNLGREHKLSMRRQSAWATLRTASHLKRLAQEARDRALREIQAEEHKEAADQSEVVREQTPTIDGRNDQSDEEGDAAWTLEVEKALMELEQEALEEP